MNKLSIVAISIASPLMLALLAVTFLLVVSASPHAEASRLLVKEGNLYRASDVFGSKKITSSNDIQLLFDESMTGKILLGKKVGRASDSAHDPIGTQLYIERADGAEEKIVSEESDVVSAFFDHSAENVIYSTNEGDIYRYRIRDGQNELLTKEATNPHLSRDGKDLVYQKAPSGWKPGEYFEGSPGFSTFNLSTKKESIIADTTPVATHGGYSPLWTPDGEHIAFFNNDGFAIMDKAGKKSTQLTRSGDGTNAYGISDDPLWSSDGRYFIYHADYRIIVIELDTNYSRVISAGPVAYGVEPRWVEEGKTISVLSPDARAGQEALSVIDLRGNVVNSDKKSQVVIRDQVPAEYRLPLTGRVSPKPVQPAQPQISQEIPPSQIILKKQPDTSSDPKPLPQKPWENAAPGQQLPANAFNKAQQ